MDIPWKAGNRLPKRNIRLQSTWHERCQAVGCRRKMQKIGTYVEYLESGFSASSWTFRGVFTKVYLPLNWFKNLIFSFSENKCWAVKLCITLSRSCYCWHCLSILFMAFPNWSNLSPHCRVVYHLVFTLARHETRRFLPCNFQKIAFEFQQMLQVKRGVHCVVCLRILLCLWKYENGWFQFAIYYSMNARQKNSTIKSRS